MNGFAYRRKRAGLTQCDVAIALGKHQSTIAKWETGKSKPRLDSLYKLSRIYRCTIDDLLKTPPEVNEV